MKIDCVLVEERAGDLEDEARLREKCLEAKAKAGLNRAMSCLLDPNLSDLSLDRMQPR